MRTTLATPLGVVPRPLTEPDPAVWVKVTVPPKGTVLPLTSSTVAVAVHVAPDVMLDAQPLSTILVAVPGVKTTTAVCVIVTLSVVSLAV